MEPIEGFGNAHETLHLLYHVINGNEEALDHVDPYLQHRSHTSEPYPFAQVTRSLSPVRGYDASGQRPQQADLLRQADGWGGNFQLNSSSESTVKMSDYRRPHPQDIVTSDQQNFQVTAPRASGGQSYASKPAALQNLPSGPHGSDVLKRSGSDAILSGRGNRMRVQDAPNSYQISQSPALKSRAPVANMGRQSKGVPSSGDLRSTKAVGITPQSRSLQQSGSGIIMAPRATSNQLSLSSTSVASLTGITAANVNPLSAHISYVSAAQDAAASASQEEAAECARLEALAKAAADRSKYLSNVSDAAREAAAHAAAAKQAADKYNQLVIGMSTHGFSSAAISAVEYPAGVSQSSQHPAGNVHGSQKPPSPPSPGLTSGALAVLDAEDDSLKPMQSSASLDDDESSDDSGVEDDSSDGTDQEHLEEEEDVEDHNVELHEICRELVTLHTFQAMLTILEMNEDEAHHIYESVEEQLGEKGIKVDRSLGIPLEEFLDELHVDVRDAEGITHLINVFKKAKNAPPSRESRRPTTPSGQRAVENSVFDKLVRYMDFMQIPAEKAPDLIEDPRAKEFTSAAEYHVLESYSLLPQELVKRVTKHMVAPPLMNSTAGQTSCKEVCIRNIKEIIAKCKAEGTKFDDPEWDIKNAPTEVLYVDKELPGYDCTVAEPAKYRRLSSIVKSAKSGLAGLFGGLGKKHDMKPIVFKGTVAAGDIVQGQIGTCFLLGAIGAMASQREESFDKIFIKYDVDVGVYGCRFCVDGEWTHVIVDDWMPVDYNGDLLFARCKDPQEVWVPVLEKAFCKLNTCYEMCDGGQATEALYTFFGGVAGRFKITDKHMKNPSSYFKLLRNAFHKGWLLTTGFVPHPGQKAGGGSGKCGEDMLPCGLVGGHAYSVLGFAEAGGNQLVCCRNPWGTGEWTGKWSDKNEFGEWTQEMVEAANFAKRDDGKFWMDIADFVQNSGGVDYARSFGPNWKKVTHYAHFSSNHFQATAKRKYKGRRAGQLSFKKGDQIIVKTMDNSWWSGSLKEGRGAGVFPGRFVRLNERSVLRFDIQAVPLADSKEPVTMIIMLMQRNIEMQRRFFQMDNGQNYKDTTYKQMGLLILNPEGKVHIQRKRHSRCIWGEVNCKGGGVWRVYAFSAAGGGSACLVRTYIKGGTMTFTEKPGTKFSEISSFMVSH